MKASVCFVGAGAINLRHAKLVRRLRPRAPIAVASRDAARASSFARVTGATVLGDYEAAFASDHTIVVIGVPPCGHRALVEQALASGKHVLVEKPAFASLDELRALLPRLRAYRAVFMTAENAHFDPFHAAVRAIAASGELGRPLLLELARLGRQQVTGWRADPAEMPLGALHEGGVHWIRRVLDLASVFEPDGRAGVLAVDARMSRLDSGAPHEDTAVVVARHRSGLTSRLLHSWALPRPGLFARMAQLQCEHGALRFDPHGRFGIARTRRGRRWILPRFGGGGYRLMWEHFLACAEEGGVPAFGLDELVDDFEYLDAAYRSAHALRGPAAPEVPRERSLAGQVC